MLTLNSKYLLKRRGLLSKDNESFLMNVYLPFIGYKSYFLYVYLVHLYRNNNKENSISYILDNTGLSLSEFLLSKKTLESVGLLQTFTNDKTYAFILKSVLQPNDFFNNPVLKGLFVNKVGKEEAIRIMNKYEVDELDLDEFIDVTAGIKESFNLNFTADDVNLNNKKMISYNNELKDNFSDKKLLSYIKKNSMIDIELIDDKLLIKIHNLAVLYNLTEEIMGCIVIDAYGDDNFNINYIKERCEKEVLSYKSYNLKKNKINISSNSLNASKINNYESTSPVDFLKEKLNGVKPLKSDLETLNKLNEDYKFNNGAINVLIEYTLNKCDGNLNKKYINKVANSLSYKGIKDSIGALDYLYKNEVLNHNKKNKDLNYEPKNDNVDIDKLNEELEELL